MRSTTFRVCGRVISLNVFFPLFADLYGEVVFHFSGKLVHGPVFCVTVDGGGCGVDPQCRGIFSLFNGFAEDARAVCPAGEDGGFIRFGIPAVHAFAGEVDEQVRAIQCSRPFAQAAAVPVFVGNIGAVCFGLAGEDDQAVVGAEMIDQSFSDKSCSSGDDNGFVFHCIELSEIIEIM